MSEYKLKELLNQKHYTLCSAESLTGGGFSYFITRHPGASTYFKGGMVTYANEIKLRLGVTANTLDKYGAVSEQCAKEMVERVQEFFKTDVAISFTGNAGPDAMENKPVGLVYIGIRIKDKTYVYKNIFDGDRELIRSQCIFFGVNQIQELLK
ncbi:MAG: CinA family protein [Bacilli bacterium]|nr:CinA family protein [Bacilli bacterium]